jgi:hypothetical protein
MSCVVILKRKISNMPKLKRKHIGWQCHLLRGCKSSSRKEEEESGRCERSEGESTYGDTWQKKCGQPPLTSKVG